MVRIVLLAVGSLFLGLGALGVFLPGLPTTPFLLLAAACYLRSSRRLYAWLLNHRLWGPIIRDFGREGAIPRRSKIISLAAMWSMILLSAFFFLKNLYLILVVLGFGAVGTIVLLLIPTAGRGQGSRRPDRFPGGRGRMGRGRMGRLRIGGEHRDRENRP